VWFVVCGECVCGVCVVCGCVCVWCVCGVCVWCVCVCGVCVCVVWVCVCMCVKMYETATGFQPRDATDRVCEKPSVGYRFVGGTGTNRNTRTQRTHALTQRLAVKYNHLSLE